MPPLRAASLSKYQMSCLPCHNVLPPVSSISVKLSTASFKLIVAVRVAVGLASCVSVAVAVIVPVIVAENAGLIVGVGVESGTTVMDRL